MHDFKLIAPKKQNHMTMFIEQKKNTAFAMFSKKVFTFKDGATVPLQDSSGSSFPANTHTAFREKAIRVP